MSHSIPAPRPTSIFTCIAPKENVMKLLRSMIALGTLFTASSVAIADQVVFEDGPNQIVLETATRDYLVHYVGDDGTLKTIRWTPPTTIDASTRSRFNLPDAGAGPTHCTLQNKKNSSQPIVDANILG